MSKHERSYWNRAFQLPNQGLRAYFGRVVKGQSEIYTAPFARSESTEQLLNAWEKHLVSISDKFPSLYAFEQDLRSKVGPLSFMKPLSQRMEDIDAYYTGVLLPSEPIDQRAIVATLDKWGRSRGLNLQEVDRTVQNMKLSTNSGSPYFSKRRETLKDTVPERVSHESLSVQQVLRGREYTAAAVLGWRGQEGGLSKADVKQRVVWMFPFAVNIEELRVYQPLIKAAQHFEIVPAWISLDAVDRSITRLFDTKGVNDLVVCTDFTKFDQHFNYQLQMAARTILRHIFTDNSGMVDWFENVYGIKYMIPLAYDYGKIRFGPHGMGSGSGGTNADETLAHQALQHEAAITNNAILNPYSQCLGDDGILSYPNITVEQVVKAYTSHGLEMNTSKQYASTTDCTYLRRWHSIDYRIDGLCVGVYSTFRALGRLRYIERYYDPEIWGPKAVALRQLSIIENVKYHPLRDQFVEFCMKRDKYRLGIDIPGFLDNLEAEAQKVIDYMPDFLGYTRSLEHANAAHGINDWWIVKYLRNRL